MLGQSQTQIMREAQKVIAQHGQARLAPRVLWARPGESAEDFSLRCAHLQNNGAHRILAAIPHGFSTPPGVQGVAFTPRLFELLCGPYSRYRAGSGGRGSGRSQAFATAIILRALERSIRVLCAREFQQSLRESVHHLLQSKITALGLDSYFEVNERAIRCITSGSEVIFAGLFQNASQLKSLEDISICYVEESQTVSKESLASLLPTIRASRSELWFSWNPDAADAPVEQFANGTRSDTRHVHVTFADNVWFPPELETERVYLQRVDADAYAHVWLGKYRSVSDAQVFAKKYFIEDFEPDLTLKFSREHIGLKDRLWALGRYDDVNRLIAHEEEVSWSGPYFGADWGFSRDPATLIKAWIFKRVLYIEFEAWGISVDTTDLPALFDTVPGCRDHTIQADNARPETISHLKKLGFPKMVSVAKWAGSVDDGIAFIRSFERVVIHSRCKHTIDEFRLYSYKIDRLTGIPTTDLEDRHNHLVDALRYSLTPAMKHRRRARISEWRV